MRDLIQKNRTTIVLLMVTGGLSLQPLAGPALTPGTWVNISPKVDLSSGTYGFIDVKFDPENRSTLYALLDQKGLWKSTDAGAGWSRIGPNAVADGDSPQQLQIDPNNGQHLYLVNGVRGPNTGFWISTDGGASWTMPAGFRSTCLAAPVSTIDCYSVAVDPTDFNHVLVSFHSPWSGTGAYNCGVVESTDGGSTWSVIMPPSGSVGPGFCIVFLIDADPAHRQGDSKTWLLATQGSGLYRTSDAGATWSLVTTQPMTHGAFDPHYISNGYLYVGLSSYPTLGMQLARSSDNGVTWEPVGTHTSLGEYTYYHSIIGDGYRLYAKPGVGGCSPYITSLESDGNTWTNFNTQDFSPVAAADGCGPTHQIFDAVNGIIYSADWGAGVWALKTAGTSTVIAATARLQATKSLLSRARRVVPIGPHEALMSAGNTMYDIRGRAISDLGCQAAPATAK